MTKRSSLKAAIPAGRFTPILAKPLADWRI
jgi:hypothetical protein